MGDTVNAVRLGDNFVDRFYVKSGKNSVLWYVSRFESVDELRRVGDKRGDKGQCRLEQKVDEPGQLLCGSIYAQDYRSKGVRVFVRLYGEVYVVCSNRGGV